MTAWSSHFGVTPANEGARSAAATSSASNHTLRSNQPPGALRGWLQGNT
ncbi:hypothetical protein HaLaN_13213, partial [Haematococcus lacustris]